MTNKEKFLQEALKIPLIKENYEKQRGYYQEYIGDDWTDDMFRWDKSYFYEWFWHALITSCKIDNPAEEDFYKSMSEALNFIEEWQKKSTNPLPPEIS